MRKKKKETVRAIMEMIVEGKNARGRPNKRWLDTIEIDMSAVVV